MKSYKGRSFEELLKTAKGSWTGEEELHFNEEAKKHKKEEKEPGTVNNFFLGTKGLIRAAGNRIATRASEMAEEIEEIIESERKLSELNKKQNEMISTLKKQLKEAKGKSK